MLRAVPQPTTVAKKKLSAFHVELPGRLLADLARRKKANCRQVGGDDHVIYDSASDEAFSNARLAGLYQGVRYRPGSEQFTPEDRQAPPRHLQARALARGGPQPSSSVLHHLI